MRNSLLRTRWTSVILAGSIVAVSLGLSTAVPSLEPGADWKFDTLQLKTGKVFKGLVVSETPAEIQFKVIKQKPGRPTVVFFSRFGRSEVASVTKLAGKDRDELVARIDALDPTGKVEDLRMKGLDLKAAFWDEERKKAGLSYQSDHFLLISNASEAIVRRAAVRLEQIYAAYTHFLPPLPPAAQPPNPKTTTTILLVQSWNDYQTLLKSQGRDILNPAFYDAARNEVVCASELQELGRRLDDVRQQHEQQLDEIRKLEAEVAKLPRGEVQTRGKERLFRARQEIARANTTNEELFQKATQQLFQTLYHEAFHAYLANFVFPPTEGTVPRWLNEGLAQIFETAIVEAGELRVGHVHEVRLKNAQEAARDGKMVPLTDLLRSGPQQFVVSHIQDRRVADRHYLTSWAVAYYLTFERRLLGTRALTDYLQALNPRPDDAMGIRPEPQPLEAFSKLVGAPLLQFEKEFHEYILKLKTDGSITKAN